MAFRRLTSSHLESCLNPRNGGSTTLRDSQASNDIANVYSHLPSKKEKAALAGHEVCLPVILSGLKMVF